MAKNMCVAKKSIRNIGLIFALLLLLIAACQFFSSSAFARSQIEISHLQTLEKIFKDAFNINIKILGYARYMQEEARPFTNPRHSSRFRFEPKDYNCKQIISLVRSMSLNLKMISGIVCYSDIPNLKHLFADLFNSLERIVSFANRSLRAIGDNDHVLYLASSKSIQGEVLVINDYIKDLRDLINQSIYESDHR